MSTQTPVIACWTKHHPIRFADLSGNTIHLIPQYHERFARGQKSLEFFYHNYRHRIYGDLPKGIYETLEEILGLMLPITSKEASGAARGN